MTRPKSPFRALREKKGFTLIEVVLGMTLSTILLLSIVTVLPVLQKNYVARIETSYSQVMAENVADAMKNLLKYAYVSELDGSHITVFSAYSDNENGLNRIDFDKVNPSIPGLTYDENYYMGKEVLVSVEDITPGGSLYRSFNITVKVASTQGPSQEAYVLERTVQQLRSGTPS